MEGEGDMIIGLPHSALSSSQSVFTVCLRSLTPPTVLLFIQPSISQGINNLTI